MGRFLFVGFVVITLVAPPASAITSGQTDTFENGTTLSWSGGAAPTNIPTGGPGGSGDHYLQISSTGGGLATRNDAQWTGNYLTAGVTAISMSLLNQGTTPLDMRILLFNSPGGNFTTMTAIPLPADNQWHPMVFGLSAADLAYVGGGTGSLAATLGNVGGLLIRHQSGAPAGAGTTTPVIGVLGIDNITAMPEPASAILLALATGLWIGRRRNGMLTRMQV